MKIGILGGTFNPPHYGHVNLSKLAIKYLQLDIIIWLVTPLNPLKTDKDLLRLEKRVNLCKQINNNYNKIKILTIEDSLQSNYTFNTLSLLQKLTKNKLIWLMGDDNLQVFHKFIRWKNIIENFNIAVFSRNPSSLQVLKCKSIMNANLSIHINSIINPNLESSKHLFYFIHKKIPLSSTKIRTSDK